VDRAEVRISGHARRFPSSKLQAIQLRKKIERFWRLAIKPAVSFDDSTIWQNREKVTNIRRSANQESLG